MTQAYRRALLAALFVLLTACSQAPHPVSTQTAAVQKSAPTPTPALSVFNFLPSFYKINQAALNYAATYKTADPLYLLVDWNDISSTQSTYIAKGYFLLGTCGFSDGGIPLRDDAIQYAKQLGADLVIYAAQPTSQERADHYIGFFVKNT
jgi:hypothetical protein